MARKVPLDRMADAIGKILAEYEDTIDENIIIVTQKVAKEGVKALKGESAAKFGGGRYSQGWTSQVEVGRLYTTATLYNKTPGLPHLLEKPHAKRGGGRTSGNPHIAPVEEDLTREFEKAVKHDIS